MDDGRHKRGHLPMESVIKRLTGGSVFPLSISSVYDGLWEEVVSRFDETVDVAAVWTVKDQIRIPLE